MKKIIERFFVALLATMTMLTCVGGGIYAEENVSKVNKSIFSEDKTRESALTLVSKPTGIENNVGEIEVEVGQTAKDTGFINTFKTNEASVGELQYGTRTFSTSLSGVVVDGKYYDIQNDPSGVSKMADYVTQDVQSAVSVNYDIKNKTGGKEITYAFKGKKSTEGKDVYVYYHYYVNGKAANGQEITRGGYLGYKIKVTPGKGGLIYDANGGTIKGQATFDDKAHRKEGIKAPGSFLPTADVDIISDEPVRGGYKFAFWYNKGLYPDPKEIYTDQPLGAGNAYVGPENLTHYEMSLPFGQSKTVTLTAVWDKEYELNFDVNGGDDKLPKKAGLLGINLENMTLKEKEIELGGATRKNGGEFKCWRDKDNKEYKKGDKFKLTENNSNVTLKAIWNITTEYVDNKGNNLQAPDVAEQAGTQKTFAGYSFVKKEDTAKGVKYIYEKNKITTQYVDDKGKKIKESFVGEEKGPKDIAGYKFVKEEATENGVKYIYKKNKITTEYVDKDGKALQEPVVGETKGEQKTFDGYKFVKEEATDKGVKYIYEKNKITTQYVDDKGNEIQKPVVGETKGEQKTFDGYKFVKEEATENGVKYIYEKIKITTEYVDKDGNALPGLVVGEENGHKEIAGYKFLREEKTANGVKYIYEKISAPNPNSNLQLLPQDEPNVYHDWDYIPYWHSHSTSSFPFYVSVSKEDEDKKEIKEVKEVKEEKTKVVKEDHNAYIMGYPDNTVRPNNTLTRAEAVAMVTRLSKLDLSNHSRASYADLKDKAWYLPNINAGLKAGMLDADEKGNLRPNEPVTRGEFVKMVAAIDKAGVEKAPFNDIAGHKYEKEINQLYSNKRIFGYGDGSFKPDAFLTRAQAASILNRVFNRVTDAEALKGFEDKIHKFSDLDKNAWYYYEMVEATNNHESESRNEKDSFNRDLERWTKLLND